MNANPQTYRNSLPEVYVDPLGDIMLDFIIAKDKEEPFIDFKASLEITKRSPFPKIAKDIFAFSNYGGGFLLIGFKERLKCKEKLVDDKKPKE
jgi:hypothetical protein